MSPGAYPVLFVAKEGALEGESQHLNAKKIANNFYGVDHRVSDTLIETVEFGSTYDYMTMFGVEIPGDDAWHLDKYWKDN